MISRLAWLPLAAAILAACGNDSADTAPVAARADSLCVSDGCGRIIDIAAVPDAENTLVTPDGRVFVSGGTGVFEIVAAGAGYTALPIHDEACNFTGLALRGDVLYANCFSGSLHATRLGATPRLRKIHDYGLSAANGLALGPEGALYLSNGPLATTAPPDPRIVRVWPDAADPLRIALQEDWVTDGLFAPNGIAIRGREVYVTDSTALPPVLGRIERISIAADGSPGERRQIASFNSIPDDLSVVGDSLLVALYTQGSVALIGPDGGIRQQTGPLVLSFPSSVRLAPSPLFQAGDLLITQKGIIGDTYTPYGNRLSILRRRK